MNIARHPAFRRTASSRAATRLCAGLLMLAALPAAAFAQSAGATASASAEEFPMKIDGDIGAGAYYTRSVIRGKTEPAVALPYAYFDYGRAFARIDTFGVKTVKMGYGYLELAGRVTLDGFKPDTVSLQGLNERKMSISLGVGTFQETPIGAFFLNAFHDVNKSNGNLFEAIYVGEIETLRVTFYPQVGAEYLSAQYVRYFYGVSAQEASASVYSAYQPGGSFNPFVGMLIDTRLTENWHLNFYLRHKWLGSQIRNSPIVERSTTDTAFVSLSYRFK